MIRRGIGERRGGGSRGGGGGQASIQKIVTVVCRLTLLQGSKSMTWTEPN